ncbi:hypothetical protein ABZP36_008325 [Zizania latifolia]
MTITVAKSEARHVKVKSSVRDIISDELEKLKNYEDGKEDQEADMIWEYQGPQAAKPDETENEDILLEMERLLYEDLREEFIQKGTSRFCLGVLDGTEIGLDSEIIIRVHDMDIHLSKMFESKWGTVEKKLASIVTETHVEQCIGNNTDQLGDGEIEIDIHAIRDDLLFELKKHVDKYLQEKEQSQQAKSEPSENEAANVSGLSHSSTNPCKGAEPVEEDLGSNRM